MINLYENIRAGCDQTYDPWICSHPRYRLLWGYGAPYFQNESCGREVEMTDLSRPQELAIAAHQTCHHCPDLSLGF